VVILISLFGGSFSIFIISDCSCVFDSFQFSETFLLAKDKLLICSIFSSKLLSDLQISNCFDFSFSLIKLSLTFDFLLIVNLLC